MVKHKHLAVTSQSGKKQCCELRFLQDRKSRAIAVFNQQLFALQLCGTLIMTASVWKG
jgi:hypothetical protein